MSRTALVIAGLALLPAAAHADNPQGLTCPQALEQILTVQAQQPVYRLSGTDERHYLEDAERPAELARLHKAAAAACSTDPKSKASEQAEAQRLHTALSPECAIAKDELASMELPGSREPADTLASKRKLVAANCPTINTQNRWLIQWDGRSDLAPLQ